jgi:hypothetical protein
MKLTLVSTMLLMGSVEVTLSNRRTHIIRVSVRRAAPPLTPSGAFAHPERRLRSNQRFDSCQGQIPITGNTALPIYFLVGS